MKTPEPDDFRLTALTRVSDGRPEQASWFSALRQDIRAGGLPGLILGAVLLGAFILELATGRPYAWGLSRAALTEGRWETLGLHAIAHGGLWHLVVNVSALLAFTPLARRLQGGGVLGWARYFGLLAAAAACSAGAYLLLHADDGLPMVGASGALCGLLGLLVRCDPRTGDPRALTSRPVLSGLCAFTISNLFLFGLLFLASRFAGATGGLAWEAHLGGFVFGLLLGPFLLAPPEARNLQPGLESEQTRRGPDWRRWRDWAVIALLMTVVIALQGKQVVDRRRDEAARVQFEADVRREVLAQASDLPDARIISFQADATASADRACGWVYLSSHVGAAPFHAMATNDPSGDRNPFVSLPRIDATDPQEWALETFKKHLNLHLCDRRLAPATPDEAPQPTLADRLVSSLWEPGAREWAIISPPSGGYLALRRRVGGGATLSPVFVEHGLAEAWTRNEGADLARRQDEEGRKHLDAFEACLDRHPVGDPERKNC